MYKLMLNSFFRFDKNKSRYYLIFITIFSFLLVSIFIYSCLNNKIDTIIESQNNRRIIINSTYDVYNSKLFENINLILIKNKKSIEMIEYEFNSMLEINGEDIEIENIPKENKYYLEKGDIMLIPNKIKLVQSNFENIKIMYTDEDKIMLNNELAKKFIEKNQVDYWQINIIVKKTNLLNKISNEFKNNKIDVIYNSENKFENVTYKKIKKIVISLFIIEIILVLFMIYIVVQDVLKKQQNNVIVLKNIGYNKISVLLLLGLELFIIINISFIITLVIQYVMFKINIEFFINNNIKLTLLEIAILISCIQAVTMLLIVLKGGIIYGK